MKFKAALFFISLSLTQPLFASISNEPEACPTIPAVKAVGMRDAVMQQGLWIAFANDYYSTKQEWTFAISTEAHDKNDAIKMGNANLDSLLEGQGPYSNHQDGWYCFYNSENNTVIAISVTPPRVASEAFRRLVK